MSPDDIKPFVDAGFAIHWLKPRDKAPIGNDWQKKPVASFDLLRQTYRNGNNVGVRLGEFSMVEGGYLHVIDLDIREPSLAAIAWAELERLFDGVNLDALPSVISGSGGESRHLYLITSQPFRSKTLAKSDGFKMVFDPKKGREVKKHDWEIALFGAPKQVAMPPSIHPDTGQPYRWEREFDFDALAFGDGPIVDAEIVEAAGAIADEGDDGSANTDRLDLTLDEARNILADLPLDEWCEDRDGWLTTGMALRHEFGDDGYELWCEFSEQSAKFDARNQQTVWKSFKGRTRRPVRMATLLDAAKTARFMSDFDDLEDLDDAFEQGGSGFRPTDEESDFDDLIDAESNDDDLSAFDLTPEEKAEDAERKRSLDWTSLLAANKDGEGIASNLHNVELIVRNDARLVGLPQLNEFTQETVQRSSPGRKKQRKNAAKDTRQLNGRVWEVKDTLNGEIWSSARDYAIRSVLEAPKTQGGYGIKVTDRDLKAAIVLAAWDNSFHPVREYLSSLAWDGESRVETLFIDYLGAEDNSYTRTVARLMMIAAVTRVFEPGAKWDFAVILEGLQGRGKSTFIRTLGKRWFAELEGDFHDGKEMVEKMQGSWIMEIPELSGFNRADVRSIKAFISRQVDKVRLAYEARATEFPRQCILIGSTNDREYLKDDTGGRRFFPMECQVKSIDIAALRGNVDHLWAEAYALYQQMRTEQPDGELPLYLADADAAAEAARLQESRRVESSDDALVGRIAAWLDSPVSSGGFDDDIEGGVRNITCLVEIWSGLGNDPRGYGPAQAQSIGRAMARVEGWRMSGRLFTFPKPFGRQRYYERAGSLGVAEPISKQVFKSDL